MSRPKKETFTLSEAAAALGLCDYSIEKYIHAGRILANRNGRKWEIPRSEIDRLKEWQAKTRREREEIKAGRKKPGAFRNKHKKAMIQALKESTATLTDPEKLKEEIEGLTEDQAAGIAAAFSGFIEEATAKLGETLDRARNEDDAKEIEAGFLAALEKLKFEGEV